MCPVTPRGGQERPADVSPAATLLREHVGNMHVPYCPAVLPDGGGGLPIWVALVGSPAQPGDGVQAARQ